MSHPIFENPVAAIESLHDSYGVVYQDGELTIEVKFFDFVGDTNTMCITARAINELSQKLHEAQMALLEQAIKPEKCIDFEIITGPTRGETYLPSRGGEQ